MQKQNQFQEDSGIGRIKIRLEGSIKIIVGLDSFSHLPEKEMATHSSVLAWRIPGTAEPDGLPSMGSHRVEHD